MRRLLSLILLLLAVGMFAACGGDDAHNGDDHDGHEHEEGDDDHEGHDHEGEEHEGEEHDEHGDHGERHEVGKSQVGGFTVTLAVFGEIEAGHEAVLDIEVEGGSSAAVRAWVGVESGRGSLKAKIDGEDGTYHGHLEVPQTLAEGSAIWVEIEDNDGKKSRTSFAIP